MSELELETEQTFTVIGFWDGDEPMVVGIVRGQHDVTGGEGVTEQGPWAMAVDAIDGDAAAHFAIEEMLATLSDEESDDE